jgi:trehalose 6-phosphate phosphatase
MRSDDRGTDLGARVPQATGCDNMTRAGPWGTLASGRDALSASDDREKKAADDPILRGAERLDGFARALARDPRAGALLFDIDGTLAPIAPTPADADVPRPIRAALAKLASRVGLLALITGREVGDGRDLVPLRNAIYIGNHGLQALYPTGEITIAREALPYVPAVETAARRARALTEQLPDLFIEDKRLSVVLHYRQVADAHTALAFIEHAVAGPARKDGLDVMTGKMAIEIRPPVPVTKGTAVGGLLRGGSYEAALFAGDDLTDITALKALRLWTGAGGDRVGLGVAVAGDETPSKVLFEADVHVAGVEGMAELIARLVEATDEDEATAATCP